MERILGQEKNEISDISWQSFICVVFIFLEQETLHLAGSVRNRDW